ncbi:UNVERIFIED_CONTAM: hypothetical protein HDU68_010810 [Siphonaria sp. JEL0065]|nr:hypothetical protein HDU68_010810 [Siphonaria sp. JEL0065]
MAELPNILQPKPTPSVKNGCFFQNLDIPTPDHGGVPADLEKYFGKRAIAYSVINPYAAPESQEALMDYKYLPHTQFKNKISTMCPKISFLNLSMLFYDHHYELGRCLIQEKRGKHEFHIQGKPRLKVYQRFTLYRSTLRGLIFTIVFVASVAYLGVYYSQYDFQHGGVKTLTQCTISIDSYANNVYTFKYTYKSISYTTSDYAAALSLVESELGCVTWTTISLPPFLSTLMCLIGMICLSLYTERHQLPKRGILRYLRQLGQPQVEEVMFSYSWQNGISQDVRCLAKALLASGIGVWIDVLKLTTGDKTSKTTRTVAAHARFVVVIMTAAYINSPNCFVEIYEALNTPGADKRVIVYCPNVELYGINVSDVDVDRLGRLARKLSEKGITVLKTLPDLIDFFNRNVIYSVDRSHFFWWQKYAGDGFGSIEEAVPPDVKFSTALQKFNLKLLMLPSFGTQGHKNAWRNELPFFVSRKKGIVYKKRVKISNVWISGDMTETGQNASAFPWPLTIFLCLLSLPFIDLYDNIGSGENLITVAWENIGPITFIVFGFCFSLFAGLLDLGDMVDRRNRMHRSLKPLIATNNFSTSKKAPKRWVGQKVLRWARAESLTNAVQLEEAVDFVSRFSVRDKSTKIVEPMKEPNLHTEQDNTMKLPDGAAARVRVAVHDFDTEHSVASTLRHFLRNLGIHQPASERDYDSKESIVVHVFIFGGGINIDQYIDLQEVVVREQVRRFNQFLVRYELQVEDCVLVGCNSLNGTMDVPGLFSSEITLPVRVAEDEGGGYHVETSAMGAYLILLASRLGTSFAEEVLLQTGLRVKNALKRYAKELQEM